VPTFDPDNSFYYAGLLLCLTFGMSLAGIEESLRAGDRIWTWAFVAGAAGCVVLYFWNVWCWVKFPSLADDYDGATPPVDSWYGPPGA
jgi:hypothetical protein